MVESHDSNSGRARAVHSNIIRSGTNLKKPYNKLWSEDETYKISLN